MRIPIRMQRLIAIPVLIVGIAILLVQLDIMLAERLELAFIFAVIYVAIDLLMFRSKKR